MNDVEVITNYNIALNTLKGRMPLLVRSGGGSVIIDNTSDLVRVMVGIRPGVTVRFEPISVTAQGRYEFSGDPIIYQRTYGVNESSEEGDC